MSIMSQAEHPLADLIPPLTLNDKCELDTQRATYAVLLMDKKNPLMFCTHHANQFEGKLASYSILAIRDERHTEEDEKRIK